MKKDHAAWGATVVLFSVLTLGAAGCSPEIYNHGHQIEAEALARIRPGLSSKEEVYRTLGSPSTVPTFNGDSWYYMSQRSELMSFYQQEITQQDVITIHFDQAGIVTTIDHHDLSDAKQVAISDDSTPTYGNEISAVQQFVGNIGRFRPNPGEGPGG